MRENRPYGSEGGEGDSFPTPIRDPYVDGPRLARGAAAAVGSLAIICPAC
jgi:hypothetical protein